MGNYNVHDNKSRGVSPLPVDARLGSRLFPFRGDNWYSALARREFHRDSRSFTLRAVARIGSDRIGTDRVNLGSDPSAVVSVLKSRGAPGAPGSAVDSNREPAGDFRRGHFVTLRNLVVEEAILNH